MCENVSSPLKFGSLKKRLARALNLINEKNMIGPQTARHPRYQ